MYDIVSGCGGLHPATRIFLWLCLLLLVQGLASASLHVFAALCLPLCLYSASVRSYLWRTRHLFLVLACLPPWTTPGVYALPSLGDFSPTVEGLMFALNQGERSFIIVVTLALAMAGLDASGRLQAILGLLLPLSRCGLPVERLALRLALTVQAMEKGLPRVRWAEWRQAWSDIVNTESPPRVLEVDIGRWRRRDSVLVAAALLGVVSCVGL